jgi:hypothetical protein
MRLTPCYQMLTTFNAAGKPHFYVTQAKNITESTHFKYLFNGPETSECNVPLPPKIRNEYFNDIFSYSFLTIWLDAAHIIKDREATRYIAPGPFGGRFF